MNRLQVRMKKELEMVKIEPPPGISFWLEDEKDITNIKGSKISIRDFCNLCTFSCI